jgi:hypothetical protein
MQIIASIFLSFFILLTSSCSSQKTELQKLQGKWRSPFVGWEMGSAAFNNKEVEIIGNQYIETTNVYFSLSGAEEQEDVPADAILLASVIETSLINVGAEESDKYGIIERDEVIEKSVVRISERTKNNPDDFLTGNVTPRYTVDEFFTHLDITQNYDLAMLNFDQNNLADLTGSRKGTTQKLGHKFSGPNNFQNYNFIKGSPELDPLGKFKRVR